MACACDKKDAQVAKVLFVDLEAHRVTGSSLFFVDLLKRRFDVDVAYVTSRHSPKMPKASEVAGYDCVICWQVTPSNIRAWSYGKPLIYVPMYDGETGNVVKWMRNRLQGIRAISFCRAEGALLRKAGVDALDVAYYPPLGERVQGDLKKVFFWERGGIKADEVRRMFPPESGFEVVVRSGAIREGDDARRSYIMAMSECGVFVAPRRLEGIGLGFLEAMAMGKCVVAEDAPTMNEYIANGKNGVLVDVDNVGNGGLRLRPEDVASIQDKAYESCSDGRRRWEAVGESAILDFIDRAIAGHRRMTIAETMKWWLLLPLHFVRDLKTLADVTWRRVKS